MAPDSAIGGWGSDSLRDPPSREPCSVFMRSKLCANHPGGGLRRTHVLQLLRPPARRRWCPCWWPGRGPGAPLVSVLVGRRCPGGGPVPLLSRPWPRWRSGSCPCSCANSDLEGDWSKSKRVWSGICEFPWGWGATGGGRGAVGLGVSMMGSEAVFAHCVPAAPSRPQLGDRHLAASGRPWRCGARWRCRRRCG